MALKFGISANGEPTKLPEINRVEVHEQLGEPITYTVVFGEDVCDGDFKLLSDPNLAPCSELTIWVEDNDKKIYLVKGPVKSHQIKLLTGGQGSELQVKGSDNSVKMKLIERFAKHEDETNQTIIEEILKNYGLKHIVVDDKILNDKTKFTLTQNRDDLSFIKALAADNGYYFWITYDDTGLETANFNELPLKSPKPVASLIINGTDDKPNNIDELSIGWDVDIPSAIVGLSLDAKTKKILDANLEEAPQDKLGTVHLSKITAKCAQQGSSSHKPVNNDGRIEQRSKAALNDAEWFIKASCSTSYDRICTVIHAHTIVEVVGAGSRHSGCYLVSGVTHTIDVASHKMQLELIRNAWNAAKPAGLSIPSI